MNNKIKGGLYGLLVGDAFGTPYEFCKADYLEQLSGVSMMPPINHKRTYTNAKVGTYSDEGAMMLCMMASLCECREFRPDHYLKTLVAYKEKGLYAVNHDAFGYTLHFERVIENYKKGGKIFHLDTAINNRDSDNLSRMFPLAILDATNDAKSTIRHAHLATLLTHADPINGICAAIYTQWIKNIVNNVANPFIAAVNTLMRTYNSECRQLIMQDILSQKNQEHSDNNVVHILMESYSIISSSHSYTEAVTKAVKHGGQTSALGAMVGCIAGLTYGYNTIPNYWLQYLRGNDVIEPLIQEFDGLMNH